MPNDPPMSDKQVREVYALYLEACRQYDASPPTQKNRTALWARCGKQVGRLVATIRDLEKRENQ